MKIGDVVTAIGPSLTPVSGIVVSVEPLKTRSGWTIAIVPRNDEDYSSYILRPEDEGRSWIYGETPEAIDALVVAEALWERPTKRTREAQLRKARVKAVMKAQRKKDSV